MATQTDSKRPTPGPLTIEQRRRVECMTFVRSLWTDDPPWQPNAVARSRLDRRLDVDEMLRITEYLVTGETD